VTQVDVRDEPAEVAGPRMMGFLQLLKYPLPPGPEGCVPLSPLPSLPLPSSPLSLPSPPLPSSSLSDAFMRGLLSGGRGAIYPVLVYLLPRLQQLKKRAYVARYLVPVDVPPEFAHDEAVAELLAQYRELQLEFKETHKLADKAVGGAATRVSPGELRKEMAQLEEERGQLVEKIAGLKKKTAEMVRRGGGCRQHAGAAVCASASLTSPFSCLPPPLSPPLPPRRRASSRCCWPPPTSARSRRRRRS
jgi:hypothetical protein